MNLEPPGPEPGVLPIELHLNRVVSRLCARFTAQGHVFYKPAECRQGFFVLHAAGGFSAATAGAARSRASTFSLPSTSIVSKSGGLTDRPVIATRTGSLPDVVEDGINGRIVPPNDAQALAAAIVDSLDPKNLENFLRQSTRTLEKFSWAEMTDIILGYRRTA